MVIGGSELLSRYSFVGLLLLAIVSRTRAQTCVAKSTCSCELSGQGLIDLNSLASNPGPLFKDIRPTISPDQFSYSYNPCAGFTELKCQNVAVCQVYQGGKDAFVVGKSDMNSIQYQYDVAKSSVFIAYDGGEGRVSRVQLICDPSATSPRFVAFGEKATKDYEFTLTTNCACPDACKSVDPTSPDGGGGSGTLSGGTILIIIVVVLIVVYLIGGVIFMQQRRQAAGADLIPNRNLWTSLPGLVKDGGLFIISSVRSRTGGYQKH